MLSENEFKNTPASTLTKHPLETRIQEDIQYSIYFCTEKYNTLKEARLIYS